MSLSVALPMSTTDFPPFVPFAKIARLRRDIVVTEKIDGTNAQVHITADGQVFAGSRNRWLTVGDNKADNFGFAAWVDAHRDELIAGLGPGTHYGEWWGSGIQRRYGLTEKRFSLFNVARWGAIANIDRNSPDPLPPIACCHVVPVLYTGPNDDAAINAILDDLRVNGSKAAPGFPTPEGIVVYQTASGTLYKVTLDRDGEPKGKQSAE